MSLKEATWEHHKNAERQEFVKVLMSGNIPDDLYATFLYNQHIQYNILEAVAMTHGLLPHPALRRAPSILQDFSELWKKQEVPPTLESTTEYLEHIRKIMGDPDKVMAHIYVRHMGDLSGGQMIKKKVPGEGRLYQFDAPVDELKELIRNQLKDDMAEEAKVCFNFATKTFKDMMEINKDD